MVLDLNVGGNVIQPWIEARVSWRKAALIDVNEAYPLLEEIIEANAPYGASVTLSQNLLVPGFFVNEFPTWYEDAANAAAPELYGG
jgi:hypothetical protein